jgi:hypothetical protein
MKKIKDLATNDFPGIDPEKFNDWHQLAVEQVNYVITLNIILPITLFIGLFISSFLFIPIFLIYLGIMLGILYPRKLRIDKMRRNIGIDDELLNSALGLKDVKWTYLILLPLAGVLLILGGGISIQMASYDKYGENELPQYIWIGLLALLVGLYCAFSYRKLNAMRNGKNTEGGIIFLGILGIIGTFMGLVKILGEAAYSYNTIKLVEIWTVVVLEFVIAVLLIFIGTRYFNNIIRKNT